MLESEESEINEKKKAKAEQIILKMKQLGKEKGNSAVYLEDSDDEAEQFYQQK